MKRIYMKPEIQVVTIQQCNMLSNSHNSSRSVRSFSSSSDGFSLKDDDFEDTYYDR